MATKQSDGTFIIAAGEVGAYTVCPQSWKLKWIDREKSETVDPTSVLGQQLHRDWSGLFEEAFVLTRWVRYVAVLISTAIVVFLLIQNPQGPLTRFFDLNSTSIGIELVLLVLAALVVIRFFGGAARSKRKKTGVASTQETVSIDGSSTLPAREYISLHQGLAGKPDAIITEGEVVIPVERKPLAKKLRDRYVAQLLVYMRLVEEFEGKRPPHGYLLLGPNCRRISVMNTERKQRWVDGLVKEMREILNGKEAVPHPHPIKCSKCDVRDRCAARADRDALVSPTRIRTHSGTGESGE